MCNVIVCISNSACVVILFYMFSPICFTWNHLERIKPIESSSVDVCVDFELPLMLKVVLTKLYLPPSPTIKQ
jgi:hypothetical protein